MDAAVAAGEAAVKTVNHSYPIFRVSDDVSSEIGLSKLSVSKRMKSVWQRTVQQRKEYAPLPLFYCLLPARHAEHRPQLRRA